MSNRAGLAYLLAIVFMSGSMSATPQQPEPPEAPPQLPPQMQQPVPEPRTPPQRPSPQDQDSIFGDARNLEPVTGSWNPLRTEEGYVLGSLASVARRGVFVQTVEGEIKLGRFSSRGGFLDRSCFEAGVAEIESNTGVPATFQERQEIINRCTELINPWPFSNYDENLWAAVQRAGGDFILMFYRRYLVVPFTDSPNLFAKIYFVDPEILPVGAQKTASGLIFSRNFHYAQGSLEGRIVKASLNGIVRKTYEIIMQVGHAGDVFRAFSISDKDLFDFAIKTMATGRFVRVSFYELFSIVAIPQALVRGYDTDYRVFRIEVLPEPPPIGPPEARP